MLFTDIATGVYTNINEIYIRYKELAIQRIQTARSSCEYAECLSLSFFLSFSFFPSEWVVFLRIVIRDLGT